MHSKSQDYVAGWLVITSRRSQYLQLGRRLKDKHVICCIPVECCNIAVPISGPENLESQVLAWNELLVGRQAQYIPAPDLLSPDRLPDYPRRAIGRSVVHDERYDLRVRARLLDLFD